MSDPSRPHVQLRPSFAPLRTLRDLFVGIEGQRGTAKTTSILTELVLRSLEYPGCRIVLARENRVDLTKTVLTTLEENVLPAFGLSVPGNQSREGRTVYDMPNGSQFIPLALRDMGKTQSFEATFGYVCEATECSKKQVTDLAAALRWLRTDARPTLPTWNQLITDVNPVGPNHWWNKWHEPVEDDIRMVKTREDYIRLQRHNYAKAKHPKSNPKRLISRHMDNPGYWDFAAWAYTPLGARYIEETLSTYTGFQRDRWLHGLWRAAEGSVYVDAFTDKCLVPPFRVPKSWPVWVYGDPGEDHPWAIGWFTISPTGRKIMIGEVHGRKLGGVAAVADLIKAKEAAMGVTPAGRFLDPRHGFASTAQSTATIAEQFAAAGLPNWMPAPRFQGKGYYASVEAVRTAFRTGQMLLFQDCVATIADHQSWSYARNSDGSVKMGDDAYEKINDDGCDIVRWFVNGRNSREEQVVIPDDEQAALDYFAEHFGVPSGSRE